MPISTRNPPLPPGADPDAELRALQRLMTRSVMRPLTADYAMRRRTEEGDQVEKIAESFVKPNDRLTSFERLEIYNRQYWFRIIDCFYDDYPGLQAVLGAARFGRLAKAYLAEHPSRCFTLRNLGSGLVTFLREQPKWTEPFQELSLDVARLEWAQIEAFDNAAMPPLEPDDLLGMAPDAIRLSLQPHISLLRLKYPADDLLIAVKKGTGELRSEASNAIEPGKSKRRIPLAKKVKPEEVCVAVHRSEDSVYYKRLDPAEFELLSALQSGLTLEKACEAALDPDACRPEEWAAKVREWFETWTRLGWFQRDSKK